MSDFNRDPWSILDEETSEQFQYFVAYRDLGMTRTIAKTAALTGKSTQWLKEVSAKMAWSDRARSWDEHVDESLRLHFKEELIETRKRVIAMATEMQRKVVQRLMALNPEELSPRDLGTWLDISTKLQLKALGEADQRVELTGKDGQPLQLAGDMSAEARQKMLLDLMADIAKATAPPELEGIVEADVVEGD